MIWDLTLGVCNFLLTLYSTNETLNQIIGSKYTTHYYRCSNILSYEIVDRTLQMRGTSIIFVSKNPFSAFKIGL
jgi:hypothetical protein